MESLNGIIYEFADFRLIPGEGLLLQDGKPIPLSLKAFATLVRLVERHGHLVQKSELIEEVWENAFVEEAAVSRCVWTIRNALGEDSKSSRFIQTIPRRGYRFVFPVSEISEGSGAFRLSDLSGADEHKKEFIPANGAAKTGIIGRDVSPAARSTSASVDPAAVPVSLASRETLNPIIRRRSTYLLLAAFVVFVAIFGWYSFVRTETAKTPRSIAILPPKPIDSAHRNVFYEDGIADALINRLSSTDGLSVRRLIAVGEYAETTKDAITVGHEQKVDYVLVSNYQIADNKIRITAQLINVANGQVEDSSFKIEKDTSSVFAIQDAVAADFGQKLLTRFGVTANRPALKRGTDNEEAYRVNLHGMNLLKRGGGDNTVAAVEAFQRAVQLDPNYSRAWSGLAFAYFSRAATRYFDGTEHDRSMDAIAKALAADPNNAVAYTVLCGNKFRFDFDRAGAEVACKHALELDPNSSDAHSGYALLLSSFGRHDEAISEIKTAIDIEPSSFIFQRWFANSLYFARRYHEAAETYRKNIELEPQNESVYYLLTKTLEAQGNEIAAFDVFVRYLAVKKTDQVVIDRYKTIFQRAGWRGVLLERIQNPTENDLYFRYAGWYARIGDRDKALEFLEKSYQRREWPITYLEVEPQIDSLRDDPRYADLVRRINTQNVP